MPRDRNGKEPGQKGYTYSGLSPKQRAQAQAIAISKAEKAGKLPKGYAGRGSR